MNKKVYNEVYERSQGLCEICGGNHLVQLHHILRRRAEETPQSCIMLCYEHHLGTKGVHGKDGHELDLALKHKVQHSYEDMGYTETQIFELMGNRFYNEMDRGTVQRILRKAGYIETGYA